MVGDFYETVLGDLLRVEGGKIGVREVEELETLLGHAEYHLRLYCMDEGNNARASKQANESLGENGERKVM